MTETTNGQSKPMPSKYHVYSHRYACDVLDEMRNCVKTLNFGTLLGLIEEAQTMYNRMEAGLGDHKDLMELKENVSELKHYRDALHAKIKKEVKQ